MVDPPTLSPALATELDWTATIFSLKKNNKKIPFLVKEYALSIAEEDFDASH